jgi:hypothetical protein
MRPLNLPISLRAAQSVLAVLLVGNAVAAEPRLSCQVSYAGTTHTVLAQPVLDPYPVPSVDIGGRFKFKAVVVGAAQSIDRILLYTYLDVNPHPVLVHQAKYLPPFTADGLAGPFTGQQFVYGGPQERELMYSCTLRGVAP